MVDTKDLKSFGQKCPCEFESRFEHKPLALIVTTTFSAFFINPPKAALKDS